MRKEIVKLNYNNVSRKNKLSRYLSKHLTLQVLSLHYKNPDLKSVFSKCNLANGNVLEKSQLLTSYYTHSMKWNLGVENVNEMALFFFQYVEEERKSKSFLRE